MDSLIGGFILLPSVRSEALWTPAIWIVRYRSQNLQSRRNWWVPCRCNSWHDTLCGYIFWFFYYLLIYRRRIFEKMLHRLPMECQNKLRWTCVHCNQLTEAWAWNLVVPPARPISKIQWSIPWWFFKPQILLIFYKGIVYLDRRCVNLNRITSTKPETTCQTSCLNSNLIRGTSLILNLIANCNCHCLVFKRDTWPWQVCTKHFYLAGYCSIIFFWLLEG